jgi:hypothetical protein
MNEWQALLFSHNFVEEAAADMQPPAFFTAASADPAPEPAAPSPSAAGRSLAGLNPPEPDPTHDKEPADE